MPPALYKLSLRLLSPRSSVFPQRPFGKFRLLCEVSLSQTQLDAKLVVPAWLLPLGRKAVQLRNNSKTSSGHWHLHNNLQRSLINFKVLYHAICYQAFFRINWNIELVNLKPLSPVVPPSPTEWFLEWLACELFYSFPKLQTTVWTVVLPASSCIKLTSFFFGCKTLFSDD